MPNPKKIEALFHELEASISREAFWISREEMETVREALPNKNAIIQVLVGLRQELGPAAWRDAGYDLQMGRLAERHEANVSAHQARLDRVRTEIANVVAMEHRLKRPDGVTAREPRRSAALWA